MVAATITPVELMHRVPPAVAAIVAAGMALAVWAAGARAQDKPVSTAPAKVVAQLAPGVYRFDADAKAREQAIPSMSFEYPRRREVGASPAAPPVVQPRFGVDDHGRQVVTVAIDSGTSLYGTGEVSGPLERRGRKVVAWNTDAYEYHDRSPSLYQSHPWALAVRADGTAFGVLADTTYRCEVDLTSDIRFTADGPAYPAIVFEGGSPQDVLTKLTDLIGRIDLPPKWAIGYHQCRFSYYPDIRAKEIARGFRDRDIPCDVIWHDIDYMDAFKVFTFHPERFPDPRAHNEYLHKLGFHTVWMIDPGIGTTKGYSVYDELIANRFYVKNAQGEPYLGKVWPGPCVFPDFTREDVRRWWGRLYEKFVAAGVDGVWNDMNEPSVFEAKGGTMPLDNRHDADAKFGGPARHDRFHNVYGMLMVTATRDGLLAARPDKRPFVLSRANFIGGHRVAAVWTGDNVASWYHLEISIPMALNLGLSGQPFSGPDIGGYKGPGDEEMFARWMGFGALLPFARGHTESGNRDKEPWAFGPKVENTCRLALKRRYELLPFYYTLFRESSRNGLPIVRPLFFADPADPKLREVDDSFLIGDGLLAFVQVTPKREGKPVLPKGTWRPVRLAGHEDADLPMMYIRGGAIVPAGPIMEYADETPLDPLTLLICLNDDGRALGELYEDAGDGFAYRDGDFLLTRYEAIRQGDEVTIGIAHTEGKRPRPQRKLIIRLVLPDGEVSAEGRDGEPIAISASVP